MSNRLQINDSKAGMQGIDKEKINAIIMKNTSNSKFYQKQKAKENENRKKIDTKLRDYLKLLDNDKNRAEIEADSYCNQLVLDTSRNIVHIDMDAFYANVEMRDNPMLRDKPMAVGSESMLTTSNYSARKYGVRAAMPGFIAKQLCPELIIVPCNFDKYHHDSHLVMELISNYDSNYKAMSLDEAYLDLTEYLIKRQTLTPSERTFPKNFSDLSEEKIEFGVDIEACVAEIRQRIYLTTRGLTASAGIACNLRLAKLCSDVNKPNGQFKLENDNILKYIRELPIKKFNGIGPSMAQTLEAYDIHKCQDLYDKRAMIKLLETQKTFEFLMHICMGISANRIEHDDVRKSLGHETTFVVAHDKQELYEICKELSKCVSNDLKHDNFEAKKVILKMKNTNFEVYSRTCSLKRYISDEASIFEAAKSLLDTEFKKLGDNLQLRLIGIRVSDLNEAKLYSEANSMLDKFVKKRCTTNEDNDGSLSLQNWGTYNCPICNDCIEGNYDFIELHKEQCFI